MYWGLDYPPLTAYHSFLCGYVAKFINTEWVALNTSRGFESYQHKLFMRYSVLVVDVLVYFPAVWWIFSTRKPDPRDPESTMKNYLLMLLYPGLILIDYGHFQYNCVSLGLAVAAVASLSVNWDLVGSVLFCLALNYKQMELYHAMPFFCFLLGVCLRDLRHGGFVKLIKIGLVVVFTFAVCWAPFLYSLESAKQVLHRLFPFARGVFEDKVANIWCSLSVVIKWKEVMSRDSILLMCLCATAVCLLPSSLDLLFRPSFKKFRYALVNSSLVFFLLSFQVHEKSILIPAVIVCTLIPDHPFWSFWFLQISAFSMLPLLLKDGLLVPYISLMCLYPIVFYHFSPVESKEPGKRSEKEVWIDIFVKLAFCISTVGVIMLGLALVIIPPPDRLPDLFCLVISIYSCGHFILFALYFHYCQFSVSPLVFSRHYSEKKNNGAQQVKSDLPNKAKKNATKSKQKKKKQQ